MAELSGNTKPLIFIFITVMIDSIGLGIIIPVLPQLLTGLTVNTISIAAQYGGALMVVYALTHFLFCAHPGQSQRCLWAQAGIAGVAGRPGHRLCADGLRTDYSHGCLSVA